MYIIFIFQYMHTVAFPPERSIHNAKTTESGPPLTEKSVKITITPPIEWTTSERREAVFGPSQISLTINSSCNKGSGRNANGDCVGIF